MVLKYNGGLLEGIFGDKLFKGIAQELHKVFVVMFLLVVHMSGV
jgi:hypothetical protein